MTAPLLSIVMPVFNVAAYLEAAVLSVLNGEFSNFELIIVNDASTDESLAVAQLFETIDDRVRIVNLRYNTLGGAGVPSNIGIEHSRGEYIGFVDSDDFLSARSLAQMMLEIQHHAADVCIGNFRTFRDDTKNISAPYDAPIWAALPKNRPLDPRKWLSVFRTSPVPWRKIYRRSFLEKHAIRFPEVDSFFEDNPLHWDVLSAARSVVFVDTFISYHRMARPGQTMSANSPQLSAFFQHMTSIAQAIHKNEAHFVWGEFLHFIFETRWIVARQKDMRIASQFQRRFFQFMHDHVLPHIGAEHAARAKTILDRHEAHYRHIEISIVIFAPQRDEQLDATMRSILALGDCEIEVMLLCQDEAMQIDPVWGEVTTIFTRNNPAKSYNLATPLCSGHLIAYLRAGDLVNGAAIRALLRDPAIKDTDVIQSKDDPEKPEWQVLAGLYRRRFIQDSALYFGPSDNGEFSFNIMSALLAQKLEVSEYALITRKVPGSKPTELDQIMSESSNVLQRVRHLHLRDEDMKSILDKISDYMTGAEEIVTLDTMKDLELSRNYMISQIVPAFSEIKGAA